MGTPRGARGTTGTCAHPGLLPATARVLGNEALFLY